MLSPNSNFLQYSLKQIRNLFPKERWLVYMYLGNWETLLYFIIYVGSLQSNCVTKPVLSQERKTSKIICLYSFVKVFWEQSHILLKRKSTEMAISSRAEGTCATLLNKFTVLSCSPLTDPSLLQLSKFDCRSLTERIWWKDWGQRTCYSTIKKSGHVKRLWVLFQVSFMITWSFSI